MENYELVCQIGKGNFGRISKIIRKSDQKTLIWKELDYGQMSEKEKEQIVSEVNILRELKHPNIVRYYDRIIDKKHSRIYIIMEYCEGGDLNQLIKRCKKTGEFIAEDIIWKIFTQVLLAIHVIHNHKEGKILHRDIKPSNVFLDKDNNVKLGDFGLSRELSNESKFAYSHVGTPYYMSPEQIDETKYNEKSDIWSLGCFLYELTTFHPPFEAKNQIMLAMRIKSGKVEKINKRYSEELWRVITWMLTVNYNNRPSSEDLLNIPQVCIRLREKRIKDTLYKLKMFEEKLNLRDKEQNEREDKLNEKEKNLKKKEDELLIKENELKEKEIELKERENELKEKEQKIKNSSNISNITTTGHSSKFPSSVNSNDLNNMTNSNNNYLSNNIDVYSIKNNIMKNMIDNSSDISSLLMYSSKNNSNIVNNNSNTNNLLMTPNTNTSINNISLINNNNNNNTRNSINNNNNNYLITNIQKEDNKILSKNSLKGLTDEYPKHNYDTNSGNNYIHYSTNNIYSDFLNNKQDSNIVRNSKKLNESGIKSEKANINNNLNDSNSSGIKRNSNVSGSFLNSIKKKINTSFVSNDYMNLLNDGEQKYESNQEYNLNNDNSFAKKLNEYETQSNKKNNNNNYKVNISNIDLNGTMEYTGRNKKFGQDIEGTPEIRKHNSINNMNSIKGLKDSNKNEFTFCDYDNYTNLISQINNINTKYGIPSKISLSNKNSFNGNNNIVNNNNKNNYENSIQNNNNNNNNNNVITSINNFNPDLLHKSSKNISVYQNSINNNTSIEKNKNNLRTVKNSSRISGIRNNIYKFETSSKVNNTSAYDFEIANKIGYETGRPSTHCGINSFTNNDNTTISSISRNKNLSKERISSLRNNAKRAKTPKINKIPARCFDNITPLKYSNNEDESNDSKNIAEKIDYGINNYMTNLNNNRKMNNDNLKKLYQMNSEMTEKNQTVNNIYNNNSSTFTNYKKKK